MHADIADLSQSPAKTDDASESMDARAQFAAICYRQTGDLARPIEVLLITSRDTGRWVIPKGWPKRRKTGYEVARLEAWEEAGVRGGSGSLLGVITPIQRSWIMARSYRQGCRSTSSTFNKWKTNSPSGISGSFVGSVQVLPHRKFASPNSKAYLTSCNSEQAKASLSSRRDRKADDCDRP